jgi:hypothetical protein
VSKILEVVTPLRMEGIEENDGEARQLLPSQALRTNVGNHILRDGVGDDKSVSKDLMANVMPADTEVASST